MRYHGKLGLAETVEVAPGVWEDRITERSYLGSVQQRTESYVVPGTIIPGYKTTTSISVFSDGVLRENYAHLRYVTYAGGRWSISSAVVEWPRLVIYIGEEYNGPLPD